MESSTPLNRNSFGGRDLRRSVLTNMMEISPLRRRSMSQTPSIVADNINDEDERSSRRNVADIQKRLSNIPHAASPNESNKFLGEQDMKDHFQICTKLFTENKITPKNAWTLHIIDLLKHITQKQNSDTFQVASTTLDISTKVYSVRVDDIHTDGLKLASNMSRVSQKEAPQDLDENMDTEGNADKENAAPKKKKKKKRLLAGEKNTICKDPKSLQAPLPKLDSVFFSTRTDAESNATDNLFTNRLKMDNLGYKFMLLSNEKFWTNRSDPLVQNLDDPNRKKYPLIVEPLLNVKICAPFTDFEVDEWDPDEEEKQLALQKSSLMETQQDVIYDDEGVPIHELDGSIHDIFEVPSNEPEDDVMSIHEEVAPQIRGEIANIVEFKPDTTNGLQQSEYTYNSVLSTCSGKLIDRVWAGPSHWKLKFIRRTTARFSGVVTAQEKQTRGRRKAQPQMYEFDEEDEEMDELRKSVIRKKGPTADFQKITLPVPDNSQSVMTDRIQEFIVKLGACPVQKKEVEENQEHDYEVGTYNYENPNDSQYCSQHSDEPNDAEPPLENRETDGEDVEEHVCAQQEFLGENLVDAPEMIMKSYVPYTMQAKKMDMKKLKVAVWQNLTHSVSKDTQDKRDKVIPTTFSMMYKELPELLTEKMQKALSCPLAFIALLHLCNEQNLKLKQHQQYKDFDINGP